MPCFTDLPLNEDLLDALYDMHFDECTPVQEHTIPQILSKNDVIGIAQTGTGKTAAYLLPLLTLLADEEHPADAVNALIMAPTRELAKQIDQALQGFSYYLNVNGVAVYGGNDGERYEQERRSLKQGADIVIATPGRLITHLQLGSLDLSRTTHLILDEADRMLDMGFYKDVTRIVDMVKNRRNLGLFSATISREVMDISWVYQRDPAEITVHADQENKPDIAQYRLNLERNEKADAMARLLDMGGYEHVIAFCNTKNNNFITIYRNKNIIRFYPNFLTN